MSVIPRNAPQKTFPAAQRTLKGYYTLSNWRFNSIVLSSQPKMRLSLPLIPNDMIFKYSSSIFH